MAESFAFKPGERINEGKLASELGVSRTPLREALNRLSIEGFLQFRAGKGFFCRTLDPQEIFDLYQLRSAIEVAGVKLAVKRAATEDIARLKAFLNETGPKPGNRSPAELVKFDERFHEELNQMSGNAEMLNVLKNINRRIHFVRWIHMSNQDRSKTQHEHMQVLSAIESGDETKAVQILERHIDRRMEEITDTVREGYSRIYMGETLRPVETESARR